MRPMLQARLDAAYQCLDLSAAQAIVDVNPGDNPYPARTDEGDQEFADGGRAGVPEEKRSYSLLLSWPEWLGDASNIAALRSPGPAQAPTRKSRLRWISRRLTRIITSAMSTAATPCGTDDPVT